jgi:hypothetical protein
MYSPGAFFVRIARIAFRAARVSVFVHGVTVAVDGGKSCESGRSQGGHVLRERSLSRYVNSPFLAILRAEIRMTPTWPAVMIGRAVWILRQRMISVAMGFDVIRDC